LVARIEAAPFSSGSTGISGLNAVLTESEKDGFFGSKEASSFSTLAITSF
jgi:hypothetical protein